MDRLERLSTFVRIVEEGSLSAAARRSGLTVPAVSKQLQALERQLGVQLLRRTTRSLTLTEAGAAVFHRARRLLADFQETVDLVSHAGEASAARLCVVGDPGVLRAVAVPAVATLLGARPLLRVELRPWTESGGRLPGEADLALVGGVVEDGPLRVARRLSEGPRVLCAAPTYLVDRPPLAEPGDLARHACLLGGTLARGAGWMLRREQTGTGAAVLVDGPLRTASDEALREAALRGLGITLLPAWLVADDLEEGRLRRVLPDVSGPPAPAPRPPRARPRLGREGCGRRRGARRALPTRSMAPGGRAPLGLTRACPSRSARRSTSGMRPAGR
ncbi:MAG: LysR family transcriptional regulator [Myxococcaceae bacterium]|nr:MAG: LysR family transcriptional regulator [Myxococcaceae bacterium]